MSVRVKKIIRCLKSLRRVVVESCPFEGDIFVLSFADGPEFRLDPDAAAPLCCNAYGEGCHTDFHKKYGYLDFTPKDFF